MIRTWQRKGSVSCLNPLQVKHSRIYWFQMLCSYNVQRDYSFSIKKFFFFFFCQRVSLGLNLRLLTWWESATLFPGCGGHRITLPIGVLRPCRLRGRSPPAQRAPWLLESHVKQT